MKQKTLASLLAVFICGSFTLLAQDENTGRTENIQRGGVSCTQYECLSVNSLLYVNENIGIGTANPGYELDVEGTIHSNEIVVEMNNLSDFVFDPDYKLMPLGEIETFIQENHHLPDIPSAEKTADKGMNVGEMNNLLLQKIEELTLHLIEQDKKIKELEAKLKDRDL